MSRRPPANDSAVSRASALLSEWTGLELRGATPRRVDEFLKTRAEQLGHESKSVYVDHLQTLEPDDPESQRLINLVTNGLTAFWRDKPQLDALATVLDKLSEARADNRPVNVWCAGCSSGEEAYTVAMIAHQRGVPTYVLGSDLNTEALKNARRGVYGEWSLRRTDQKVRERYFSSVDGRRFRVDPRLREQVDFLHHNILDTAPDAPNGEPWDVILCRNVLIYFSDEATQQVLRRFGARLQQDGYLLLGSSEQLHTGQMPDEQIPFRAARQGGGFVYRLRQMPPGQTVRLPTRRTEEKNILEPATQLSLPSGLEETTSEPVNSDDSSPTSLELLERAVTHLKNGRVEAAIASCEATASYDPFVAEAYCLMGYLLARRGARSRAIDAYRKVLFLDPLNWMAAVESARLQMRRGDVDRALMVVRQGLEGLDSGEPLSEEMQRLAEVMHDAITDPVRARAFCERHLEQLRREKFVD